MERVCLWGGLGRSGSQSTGNGTSGCGRRCWRQGFRRIGEIFHLD
jgi:hypothetical protein